MYSCMIDFLLTSTHIYISMTTDNSILTATVWLFSIMNAAQVDQFSKLEPYQQFDIGSVLAGHRHTRRADVGVRRRPNVVLLIGPTSGRRLRRPNVGPTWGRCQLPAVPQCNVSGSLYAQPMLGRCQTYMWPTSGRRRAYVRPTFDHQKIKIYLSWIPGTLVIPSRFISWKNPFCDVSRKWILPNTLRAVPALIIFGKIHLLLTSENDFFHEIKRDGITSLHGIHESET